MTNHDDINNYIENKFKDIFMTKGIKKFILFLYDKVEQAYKIGFNDAHAGKDINEMDKKELLSIILNKIQ